MTAAQFLWIAYVMLLEERKPDLGEEIIINYIVKFIYFFKNDLLDQQVAIFILSSKLTPWKVIFIVQPPFPSGISLASDHPPTPSEFPIPCMVRFGWNHPMLSAKNTTMICLLVVISFLLHFI